MPFQETVDAIPGVKNFEDTSAADFYTTSSGIPYFL